MRFIAILLFFIVTFAQSQIQSFTLNDDLRFLDENGAEIQISNSGGFQSVYLQALDIDKNGRTELLFTSLDIGLLHVFEQDEMNSLFFTIKEEFEFTEVIARWFHFIDFNNDGIYDLLTLDNFDVIGYRMNNGTNLKPSYSTFKRLKDQNDNFLIPELGNIPVLYDFYNRGKKDLFLSTQSQGNIIHYENFSDSIAEFKHITNNFANVSVLGRSKKHGRSSFAFIDLDKDLDTDILWGDQFQNYFYFVENTTNDTNPVYVYDKDVDYTGGNAFESLFTYNVPIITDLNNDSNVDIIMLPQTDPRNNIQVYLGTDSIFKFELYEKDLITNLDFGFNSSLSFYDLNEDGDLDIIIGSASNSDSFFETHYFLKNDLGYQKHLYSSILSYPWEADKKEANDFQIIDLNADLKWDILFVDPNGDLFYSLNEGTNILPQFKSYSKQLSALGNFAQFQISDINSDGELDLLTSQILGNFYIYKSFFTPSSEKIKLTNLSSQYDHLVTFDQLFQNEYIIYDDQNKSYQHISLDPFFKVVTKNSGSLNLPYTGRSLNLAIMYSNINKSTFIFGGNNGGVISYDITFDNQVRIDNKITFYPNPSRNIITIIEPNNEKVINIKVYNLAAKLILNDNFSESNETIKISLKNQSSGVYFLLIKTNKNIYRRKLIHVEN